MPRPIKALIDAAALRHNLAVVRRHAPRASVLAVVKANAYGHGLARTVHALAAADGVALLEIDAAVRLREGGYAKRIALLQGVFGVADLQIALDHDLTLVVHNREQLQMLASANSTARLDVLLKINTGMNRLGFPPSAAVAVLTELRSHRVVNQVTLMAHFATADEARGVAWQMKVFDEVAANLNLPRSVANSAALLRYPETHADWVRPGIMLYGCSPFADVTAEQLGLKPVMTLTSEIIAVQELAAGDQLGYGGAFVATGPTRVGIVACGYADGYPRHAPTGTPLLVGGRRTRTLGRVAMDMLCADLTGNPAAGIGTPVTLWGAGLSADEVAWSAATVSYELLCALAPRVPVVDG
jgi:alanine racemase